MMAEEKSHSRFLFAPSLRSGVRIIMMTIFDEEYILKTYIEQEKREAAEKAERKAKEAAKEIARKLYQKGTSTADIADAMSVPEDEVRQWLGLVSR